VLKYPDGSPILPGDRIVAFHGEEAGRVVALIETDEDVRSWGVEEPGIMLEIGQDTFFFPVEYLQLHPIQQASAGEA